MHNILNPLHYIAANKQNETIGLIVNKYNLPEPQTQSELFEAVDYASSEYGSNFIDDMTMLHPDREFILSSSRSSFSNAIEDQYKTKMAHFTADQLITEIAALNSKLVGNKISEADRADNIEKITFLTELIKSKQSASERQGGEQAEAHKSQVAVVKDEQALRIHKTNQIILYVLMGLALIYIGSKLAKKQ